MSGFREILAVGDCNTLGANELQGNSYPEIVGRVLGARVRNLGHTMATTREGVLKLQDNPGNWDLVCIQFGLVDSYKTFKYSPYVLYYPDNFFRKQIRSLVKKYKKSCRKYGLNKTVGEMNVVSLSEYEENIRKMIELAVPATTFLLDTVPNHQRERNAEIRRYNAMLENISSDYDNCFKITLYSVFEQNMDRFYQDQTHCNREGYEHIAKVVLDTLAELSPR